MAVVGIEGPDPLQAVLQDGLAGEQVVVLVHAPRYGLAEGQHVVAPAVGQVGGHPAGADVVVVHPQPGHLLEEGQHQSPGHANRRRAC